MASRKQILTYAVLATVLVGAVFTSIPFVASLKPNLKAKAALPSFQSSSLEVGAHLEIREPESSTFAIRRAPRDFSIFYVWRPRLGSEAHYIVDPGNIYCQSIEIDASIKCVAHEGTRAEWSLTGEPIDGSPSWIQPIEMLPYTVSGGHVIYGVDV